MPLTELRVRGPFRGPSGYDHHVREFVRELHKQGLAVELIDLPEWSSARLPPPMRDPWFEALNRSTGARVVLHFTMPHQVVIEPGCVNVNYTMFEATRIPSSWVAASRDHDVIILPTESSRSTWRSSGVPDERIRLCPLGINPSLFGRSAPPLPLRRDNGEPISQYRVRFLNVSELGPRKNLEGLLRAWLRATMSDDDAVLVVKLGAYASSWLDVFRHQIARLQQEVGRTLDDAAPVHFVHDIFADADMPRLYAAATHYISLSFGEGWDQAMVEAAASGLRLIAPDHSAYPTYLNREVAHLVTSREVPATFPDSDPTGALFAGANWWQPDEDEAVGYIQAAIRGDDFVKASAREHILRDFTWERATRRLIEILDEVEAKGKRRRLWQRLPWSRRA